MKYTQLLHRLKRVVLVLVVVFSASIGSIATAQIAHAASSFPSMSYSNRGAYINPSTSTSLASAATLASMKELKSTGANEVLFVFPFQQTTVSSYTFHPYPQTPSPATLKTAVSNAHSIGLKAYISFHVEYGGSGHWRAAINPVASHRAEWYHNYGNVVIANSRYTGADGVLVGTEMYRTFATSGNPGYPVDSNNHRNVAALIKRIRGYFHRAVSYDAQVVGNFGDMNHIDWSLFNDIWATTYFAIAGSPNTSAMTSSLEHSYASLLGAVHRKYPTKSILAGETGYRSVTGASTAPYSYQMTGPADESEQSRDYSVLFATLNHFSWIKGVGLWYWESGTASDATDFSPRGKKAEVVMTKYFGGTYKPPVVTPPQPVLNIWWPAQNGQISCTQPFKAVLDDSVDKSSYKMFWSVGPSGRWVKMYPNSVGGEHFEASVMVSTWHWEDSNNSHYVITYHAQRISDGVILAEKPVDVFVDHSGDSDTRPDCLTH